MYEECLDPNCRCSGHPETCCSPESIQKHNDNVKMVEKRERAKRQAGAAGTSVAAVGS